MSFSKKLLVIDGDEVLYKSAFASQFNHWYVRHLDGSVHGPFRLKAECYEWIGNEEHLVDELFSEVVAQEEYVAKGRLDKLLKEIIGNISPDDYIIYLTGKGNFRFDVATVKPYKGNRTEMAKPVHYQCLRDRLLNKYGAREVDGIEADDALSIAGWRAFYKPTSWEIILATQDKDLNMVPGSHYNPTKKEYYQLNPQEARLNFYSQLLTGDDVDNIPGVTGIGKVTAKKLLKALETKPHADIINMIKGAYLKEESKIVDAQTLYGLPKMEEVGKLLWMLQELGQDWSSDVDYYEGLY